MKGIAGIERGLRLDQVTGEHRLRLVVPDDDIARGMATTAEPQLQAPAVTTQLNGHPLAEGQRRMGQAGNGGRLLEQARHAAELAVPVLQAALVDELAGHVAADDGLGAVGARAEHTHRVVVGQHEELDRLVGVLAQFAEPLAGGDRCGARLDADQKVFALDGTDVRIALRGQRVDAVGEDFQGLFLRRRVGARCEGLGHQYLREEFRRTPPLTCPEGPVAILSLGAFPIDKKQILSALII